MLKFDIFGDGCFSFELSAEHELRSRTVGGDTNEFLYSLEHSVQDSCNPTVRKKTISHL